MTELQCGWYESKDPLYHCSPIQILRINDDGMIHYRVAGVRTLLPLWARDAAEMRKKIGRPLTEDEVRKIRP